MERIKIWFQKTRKPLDYWIFCKHVNKLTKAIYKYALKNSFPRYTEKDALKIAKAIIWNNNEIKKIIGN
jgi:hypothetical protein